MNKINEYCENSEITVLDDSRISITNAVIIFPNFSGSEKKDRNTGKVYNALGNRNFVLILPKEAASDLYQNGWNIKTKTDENGEEYCQCKVKVNLDSKYPPQIIKVTRDSDGNMHGIRLTKDMARAFELMDASRILIADITINPWQHDPTPVGGFTITPYLQRIMFEQPDMDDYGGKYKGLIMDDSYEEEEDLPF